MALVFVNYRMVDAGYGADAVAALLAEYLGREQVFLDHDSMAPGDDYPRTIRAALARCDALVAIIGPRWLTASDDGGVRLLDRERDWVREEIADALARGVRVVPVLLRNVPPPAAEQLPPAIRGLARMQARPLPFRELGAAVRELVDDLVRAVPALRAGAPAVIAVRERSRSISERIRSETAIMPGAATTGQAFWAAPYPDPAPDRDALLRRGPSGLLSAASRVVGFVGRDAELGALATWRDAPGAASVTLLHGPGGQGKTRLAARFAELSAAQGWAVVQARHASEPRPPYAEPAAGSACRGLLVVVDYAERWPRHDLLALFQDELVHQDVPARVLLLSRPAGLWWQAYAHPLLKLGMPVADRPPLGPLAEGLAARRRLFDLARDAFAGLLGATRFGSLRPSVSLADDAFGLALTVHMAALVAVDAHLRGVSPPTDPGELSGYLLDREADHWATLHATGRVSLRPSAMGRLVAAAALVRPVEPDVGERIVCALGLAGDRASARLALEDHALAYPPSIPGTVLQPLEPDRLAEDQLAHQLPGTAPPAAPGTPGTPDLPGDSLAAVLLSPELDADLWRCAASAVTVLAETARRWEHVRSRHLLPIARRWPGRIVEAGGAGLVALAELADQETLDALAAELPGHRDADLDTGIAAISQQLTSHGLATTTDPARRAALHENHGWRLANAGLHEQALQATAEAVALYEGLAAAQPATYEADLGGVLSNLSIHLAQLGRADEALAATRRAVDLHERLAQAEPEAFEPDLAASLNNLANRLADLGRDADALAASERALVIYRRLAAARPSTYEPDLAMALANAATARGALGRHGDALDAAEQAVALYRRLAAARPAEYEPDFTTALRTLGIRLARARRQPEALATSREEVELLRHLAAANPASYEPELASALNNLANRLLERGLSEDALDASLESAALFEQLADRDPRAFEPHLARTLGNLGAILSGLGLGRAAESVSATERAVVIYRRLAATHEGVHAELALTLSNLGARQAASGQVLPALAAADESARLFDQLAAANPDAHLPDLAMALANLGQYAAATGDATRAREVTERAVHLRRELAAADESQHGPALATAVKYLALILALTDPTNGGLETSAEAVTLHRRYGGQTMADTINLAEALTIFAMTRARLRTDLEPAHTAADEAIALFLEATAEHPGSVNAWLERAQHIQAELTAALTPNQPPQ